MKKVFVFIALMSIVAASCVKDRLQPKAGPVVVPHADTLMYYWDFNAGDPTNFAADVAVNGGARFDFYCAYIDFTGGSNLNLQLGDDSGQCLRLRNPFDSVIFHMPTTGYDSITIAFAEEASGSGPSSNAIYYTTDGINYISTGLGNNSYAVGTTFSLNSFSFVSVPNVKNNAKFAIKIVALNNNTGTSGNDRIDNVTMMGVHQ